jgi:hypothetical protein
LFAVESRDLYQLIESPYYQEDIEVLDSPPLSPGIDITPVGYYNQQRGEFDYIEPSMFNINLAPRSGETITEAPVKILDQDAAAIDRMIASSPRGLVGEVVYKGDTLPIEYQVLLIEAPPSSYRDFANARVISSRTPAGIVDIAPNTDYYITCRAIDFSGISNPSEVYRVKINASPSGNSLEFDVQEFVRPGIESIITFRDFLSIEAAPSQSIVNYSSVPSAAAELAEFWHSAPPAEQLTLGVSSREEDLVWDRKFKFRLKSKHTGKAIDLNVKFKEKKVVKVSHNEPGGVYVPSIRQIGIVENILPDNSLLEGALVDTNINTNLPEINVLPEIQQDFQNQFENQFSDEIVGLGDIRDAMAEQGALQCFGSDALGLGGALEGMSMPQSAGGFGSFGADVNVGGYATGFGAGSSAGGYATGFGAGSSAGGYATGFGAGSSAGGYATGFGAGATGGSTGGFSGFGGTATGGGRTGGMTAGGGRTGGMTAGGMTAGGISGTSRTRSVQAGTNGTGVTSHTGTSHRWASNQMPALEDNTTEMSQGMTQGQQGNNNTRNTDTTQASSYYRF